MILLNPREVKLASVYREGSLIFYVNFSVQSVAKSKFKLNIEKFSSKKALI